MNQKKQEEKSRRMRASLPALVLFLIGAGIFLYPVVSNILAKNNQMEVIRTYDEAVDAADEENLERAWEWAEKYNQSLAEALLKSCTQETDGESGTAGDGISYEDVLNLQGDGVMGYLEIPAIDVYLPIYHGTTEEVLKKGVGHLKTSSLPIGGASTHAVLSAHRGLPSASLFTRLDELEAGDVFYIHVLGEVLAYEVDQITVTEPDQLEDLAIEEGMDYVTLLTCTPYGVNTHRLLVRGVRIDDMQEEEADQAAKSGGALGRTGTSLSIGIAALLLVLIAGGLGLLLYPVFSDWLYRHRTARSLSAFEEMAEEGLTGTEGAVAEETAENLQALYEELKRRNEELYLNHQDQLTDASAYEQAEIDLTEYGIDDNIIAYISIPAMDITLPVLLGANTENMKLGAVHLTQTSYPIGGENTNSVIAAHRGYSGTAMFRDIEELQVGDLVYMETLWETLTYEVTELRVIDPDDVEELLIQEGKDMLTLITCHPYRHHYQRYVVYCERVES